MKTKEWHELTRLTQGEPLVIERVRLANSGIVIEGDFELPALARLTEDDQVFVMAFVRCEGTIKEMEKAFGVSYPTIKSKLGKIAAQMQFVEVIPKVATALEIETANATSTSNKTEKENIIAALEKGEITALEAIERLRK